MSYMKDLDGTRLDGIQVVGRRQFQGLRTLAFPGALGLPAINAAAATVAVSAANATSSITSAQLVYPTHENFRVIGGNPSIGTAFPETKGWYIGAQWVKTSAGPWGIEFDLDTVAGVFEMITKGNSANVRVLVNGQLTSAAGVTTANDGQGYLISVNLGSGGAYRIRLEFNGVARFWGINVGPTDLVTASAQKRVRYAWLGDSFAEPTISDPGSFSQWQGMVQIFGSCTGLEMVPAGSGGTGLVNPGTSPKVKYGDRLAEVLAFPNLDGLIIQMSGNDQNYLTADVLTQLQACITAAQNAGLKKYGQIIVVSSWWIAYSSSIPASLVDKNDQARTLCASLGIPYVDVLTPAITNPTSGTLAAASSTSSNSLSLSFLPPAQSFLKLGSGSTTEVRQVTNPNVTAASAPPYTVSVNLNPSQAHPLGDPVLQVGGSLLTGTGKVGATTGTGSADRMTGSDGTHPTVAGHRARGIQYASALGRILVR